VGTSNTGIGTYGLSFGNHGVYGYSTLGNFAGVVGSHANANGIGVLGDIQNSGVAVMGKSSGTSGKAGVFMNNNAASTDTTLLVTTAGQGTLGYFNISNANNTKAAVACTQKVQWHQTKQTKTNGTANIDIINYGNGHGLYSQK
jgi:hypothetical protein